jgi:uncharacterized protein YndB with AHSA1/START domain
LLLSKIEEDAMTITDDTTLFMTRTFDAPPERVFNAWLDREAFQSWIGPEGVKCDVPVLEPRVGGRYRIDMKLSSGMVPVSGEFRVIEKPSRIVFTWGWDGDPARQSLITLTFREAGGKTEFTLKQEGLGTKDNRDAHEKGWTGPFKKLAAYLAA